jgi:hypothetical protein
MQSTGSKLPFGRERPFSAILVDRPQQRSRLAATLSANEWFVVAGAVARVQRWPEEATEGYAVWSAQSAEALTEDVRRLTNAVDVLIQASQARRDSSFTDQIHAPGCSTEEQRDELRVSGFGWTTFGPHMDAAG